MKKQSFSILALAITLTLTSAFAFAGSDRKDAFNIDVPFEFQIGKQVFEAGEYQVFRENQSRLVIENRETGEQRLYLGNFDGNYKFRDSKYTLRFNKYGDTYFLREVNARGASFDLPKTKAEKRESKKMQKKATKVLLGA